MGTCDICGCTDDRACVGNCNWTDDDRTRCTTCEVRIGAARVMLAVVDKARELGRLGGGPDAFDRATTEQQRLLAMGAGAILELALDTIGKAATEDLETLQDEVGALVAELDRRNHAAVVAGRQQQASLKDLVVAVLEGRERIVLVDR